MQRTEAPLIELSRAREAIERLIYANSLADFEEHWTTFLHRLERTWNKTKAHYSRSPKWGNWSHPVEDLRRKDALLSYLVNARGAEEHTVGEITSREPGSIGIGLPLGVGVQADGSVVLDHLEIKGEPNGLQIQSAQPLQITFTPARSRMVAIVNRGRRYEVPSIHLGRSIDPHNLPEVARLALSFYADVVARAEAHFIK